MTTVGNGNAAQHIWVRLPAGNVINLAPGQNLLPPANLPDGNYRLSTNAIGAGAAAPAELLEFTNLGPRGLFFNNLVNDNNFFFPAANPPAVVNGPPGDFEIIVVP